MKKLLIVGVVGLFSMSMYSCGRHTPCAAYGGQADYTKYKKNQNQKIKLAEQLLQTKVQ
ncbi:hypothetical protein K6119_05820 [Paracrocinitomix mangrovi]|uniref:hypothetical protein n=1 Tax=Paracrocinitomix mangrovi TaxID=2862509 RepID=UPI001C8DC1AF|nr:hypothetical protein [Paracrocinitomix mangrovi]UKN03032.1 hypothetical protein K6119_05820 [Paracrocinitomix mangrovi]